MKNNFKIGDLVRISKERYAECGSGIQPTPEQLNKVYRVVFYDRKSNLVEAKSILGDLKAQPEILELATEEEELYSLIRKGTVCHSTKDDEEGERRLVVTKVDYDREKGRYGYITSVEAVDDNGEAETYFPDELLLPTEWQENDKFNFACRMQLNIMHLQQIFNETEKRFFETVDTSKDVVILENGELYQPVCFSTGEVVIYGDTEEVKEDLREGDVVMPYKEWLLKLGLYLDPKYL